MPKKVSNLNNPNIVPNPKYSPIKIAKNKIKIHFFKSVFGFFQCCTTVLSYAQAGILTTELPTKNWTLNLLLSFPTKHKTPACV
jgi:hypothetical protein